MRLFASLSLNNFQTIEEIPIDMIVDQKNKSLEDQRPLKAAEQRILAPNNEQLNKGKIGPESENRPKNASLD